MYDERTNEDIERAYKLGKQSEEILIAGHMYVINFETGRQLRRDQPMKRRRIKRDLISVPIKGVAGLKLNEQPAKREMRTASLAAATNSNTDRTTATALTCHFGPDLGPEPATDRSSSSPSRQLNAHK